MTTNIDQGSNERSPNPGRLTYVKPGLKTFGLISELTAAGSGLVSEQNDNDMMTVSCSATKTYIAACMGTPGTG